MRNPCWIGLLAVALWAGVVERAAAEQVQGIGRSAAAARAVALEKAQDAVLAQLRKRLGEDWQPISGQLDPEYLQRLGVIRPEGEPTRLQDPEASKEDWVATFQVEVTDRLLKQVNQEERKQRMMARYGLAGRVLAGLVVLLLVTTGYLRLELLTAGYYTRLLRVGAVALVALAVIGLWLSL
jgi:hypothetical protein